MRKVFLIILTLAILFTPLVACATDTDSPALVDETPPPLPEPTPEQPESETPIEVPARQVTLFVWESAHGPDEFIRQAGSAFTAQNPNITIEFVHVDFMDTVERMLTDGAIGAGADLFVAPHDRISELAAQGLVSPVANAANVANLVLGAAEMAATYNGIMYGYPIAAETYALFYNRALISNPPSSFEGVVEFSEGFNEPVNGRFGFFINVTSSFYSIIFTTSGDNLLFGNDGTDLQNTNLNTLSSVEGMTFFQELREILNLPADSIDDEMGERGFMAGDIAMYVTGPWNLQKFIDAGIDFGVAPLPSLPGETTPARSFSTVRNMFVSSFTHYPEEAHAFAEFLLTQEMQELRFELTGEIPSVNIPIDDPHIPGLLTQLDYGFPIPSASGMRLYWDIMSDALRSIWNGADVQEQLDSANAAILAG